MQGIIRYEGVSYEEITAQQAGVTAGREAKE